MPGESRTASVSRGPTLAHVIAANAQRRPDAQAVVDGGARRTYGDLLDRATRLGHGLRSHIAQPCQGLVIDSIQAIVQCLARQLKQFLFGSLIVKCR
jgi:non-ribosomal peptide synthetase component F